ncbi:MAG: metallo-mystery pair system four-Cys motif protein [Deltaproteobacteria bacterium]|nr:metallo-mystery pair system four-Cys motif protein [Deltaproteobacteria bacterium]
MRGSRFCFGVCATLALAWGAIGCGGDDEAPVQLSFTARVGAAPFACGTVYPGVGTTAANVSVEDFRMFISNVRTLDAAGGEHPVKLVADQKWQSETVALLDFENASGPCGELGTPETNASIRGMKDGAKIAGVRFSLGVPEGEAHQNVGLAKAPLNLGSMFWGWQAGYKFLRVDFSSTGDDPAVPPTQWLVHIGSTGCQSAAATVAPTTACARSNRAEITLLGWDPSKMIVVDLAALLNASNVLLNTVATAPGCMSDASDPECQQVLAGLGLDASSGQCAGACSAQKFFRVE